MTRMSRTRALRLTRTIAALTALTALAVHTRTAPEQTTAPALAAPTAAQGSSDAPADDQPLPDQGPDAARAWRAAAGTDRTPAIDAIYVLAAPRLQRAVDEHGPACTITGTASGQQLTAHATGPRHCPEHAPRLVELLVHDGRTTARLVAG